IVRYSPSMGFTATRPSKIVTPGGRKPPAAASGARNAVRFRAARVSYSSSCGAATRCHSMIIETLQRERHASFLSRLAVDECQSSDPAMGQVEAEKQAGRPTGQFEDRAGAGLQTHQRYAVDEQDQAVLAGPELATPARAAEEARGRRECAGVAEQFM